MKTFSAKPHEVEHQWWLLDATDQVLGRLASRIAMVLRGKHKAIYTPHVDTGDFVVVVHAEKLRFTGQKLSDKMYYNSSGRPGGLRQRSLEEVLAKRPEEVLELAVRGMLPKGPLGNDMFRKLKVYAGAEHRHSAQQPQPLSLSRNS